MHLEGYKGGNGMIDESIIENTKHTIGNMDLTQFNKIHDHLLAIHNQSTFASENNLWFVRTSAFLLGYAQGAYDERKNGDTDQ